MLTLHTPNHRPRSPVPALTRSMHWTVMGLIMVLATSGHLIYGQDARGDHDNGAQLLVLKNGDEVYIRGHYSDTHDLLRIMNTGRNNKQINFSYTGLLPAGTSKDNVSERGIPIHYCGDDAAPWLLNGTYIGGNHGCYDALEVTSVNHGFTAADIGAGLEDATGNVFYVMGIVAPDKLMVLSQNKGDGPVWKFITTISGNVLADKARGKRLEFSKYGRAQLWPACRINRQAYLIDGIRPLQDGEAVHCRFLDIVDDYDIIDPAAQLAHIIANPGKEPDLADAGLDGVVNNHIVYRFFPGGQTVVFYKAKALKGFNLGYMGFFQTSRLRLEDKQSHVHEYYIPKTLPYTVNGAALDFKSVQDVTTLPAKVILSHSRNNIEDPGNLPERFIQFVGNKQDGAIERKIGYAVGYSLLTGVTVPAERAKNNHIAGGFGQTSQKTYASAISGKMGLIPKGMEFQCIVYRIYFNPEKYRNPTCVYWYDEGENTVVYIDYHHSTDRDAIQLPPELTGKKISVVEQTPSLTLHTGDTVPAGGVEVSVKDYGYIVLKIH